MSNESIPIHVHEKNRLRNGSFKFRKTHISTRFFSNISQIHTILNRGSYQHLIEHIFLREMRILYIFYYADGWYNVKQISGRFFCFYSSRTIEVIYYIFGEICLRFRYLENDSFICITRKGMTEIVFDAKTFYHFTKECRYVTQRHLCVILFKDQYIENTNEHISHSLHRNAKYLLDFHLKTSKKSLSLHAFVCTIFPFYHITSVTVDQITLFK